MAQKNLKILIVEDSSLILERMYSNLSELSCVSEVFKSMDGNDAIDSIKKNQPDVIFLDINLPGKNGISVLSEIKGSTNAKVIMLTNFTDQYYRDLCAKLGADHFLDKSTEFDRIPELLINMTR